MKFLTKGRSEIVASFNLYLIGDSEHTYRKNKDSPELPKSTTVINIFVRLSDKIIRCVTPLNVNSLICDISFINGMCTAQLAI